MRMVWGQWFYNNEYDVTDLDEVKRFREVMKESSAFDLGNNESNFGDFVPFFRWIDYRGYPKKLRNIEKRLDDSFNELIHLYRSKRRGMERQNTMVDHLLSSQETEPEFYTDEAVKALIPVMVAGASAATALEWMMANLVNHPDELEKAREELKAWDPQLRAEPDGFKPERYDNGEGDVRNLITFGMGRRACPGEPLAMGTMGLTAAVLIQCFDWKRIGREAVDMTAANGLVMRRAAPLEALCKARPIVNKIQLQSL
ncbi:isoflavone 2'-hydroxylase-like [Neltuma alba]|uniref:isoflavone 2'-hydroxylase-like n=1 Tax=Neltuma alba TaxID=207710 RepID=UPI0010A5349F|nr:isoflavone 2'-hydroxylase-like [Prosopis alba]